MPKRPSTPNDKLLHILGRQRKGDIVSHHEVPNSLNATYLAIAEELDSTLPSCPEKTVALRKLLESMDAAKRCYSRLQYVEIK